MKCAVVSSETKTGQGSTTGEGHYAVKNCTFPVKKCGWEASWEGGHYKRGSMAYIHITHLQNLKNSVEGHTNV
jgi:hypothetical protein